MFIRGADINPASEFPTEDAPSFPSIDTPARNERPPGAAPVRRSLGVEQRSGLLHLCDVVGDAQLLILLIGRIAADVGAIASRCVGVKVEITALPLRVYDGMLGQRLKLRNLLGRLSLMRNKAGG